MLVYSSKHIHQHTPPLIVLSYRKQRLNMYEPGLYGEKGEVVRLYTIRENDKEIGRAHV